jgi:hypothetical protein
MGRFKGYIRKLRLEVGFRLAMLALRVVPPVQEKK